MERVLERCCALDIHKQRVTACVHVPDQRGRRSELRAEFSTVTGELLALRDWLKGLGVSHVAMEATGVYWKPVYYLLEDDFELLLVNAQHVKNVPGRKTDVEDAQWFCQLLEHGLVRASFVPPKPIRELRDLSRYRKSLVWERSPRGEPAAEAARGRQHQARRRGLGRARRLGQGDAAGALPGRVRPRCAGRTGQGQAARQAAGTAARARGPLPSAPRPARLAAAVAHRVSRRDDRLAVGGDRGAAAPFRVKA